MCEVREGGGKEEKEMVPFCFSMCVCVLGVVTVVTLAEMRR